MRLALDKLESNGEVSEWPKEHAWKVCIRKRIEGSNPSLTAINRTVEVHRRPEKLIKKGFSGFFMSVGFYGVRLHPVKKVIL
jgi:hypothetical protein